MAIQESYNEWSSRYDTDENKTRDLEAIALRKTLPAGTFEHCLEIGCGTGKNTAWLLSKAKRITAVDFSEKMLEQARRKIDDNRVRFVRADITRPWTFASNTHDLITFSLVLEHIEDLNFIFQELSKVTAPGGYVYIGELHPYKQYEGSKARFSTGQGDHILTCYQHHISEFTQCALQNNFSIIDLNEFFDDDAVQIPRIVTLVLRKNG